MKNPLSYEGRRVVVTGAGSGMGEATALLLKDLGAHVTAVDIKKPKQDFTSANTWIRRWTGQGQPMQDQISNGLICAMAKCC